MKIPILTYHSLRGPGDDYASNDHLALQEDLRLLHELGGRVIDLGLLVECFSGRRNFDVLDGPHVAITFDDGAHFDFFDFFHPDVGYCRSFFNIILASDAYRLRVGDAFATSFVIASPCARKILDRECIAGRDEWNDTWWLPAARSGVLRIANHSWDHVHPNLPHVAQQNQQKGSFLTVTCAGDAEVQIIHAQDYIESILGDLALKAFAYPYGEVNDFLSREYLPTVDNRVEAAFTTEGGYVTEDCCRWTLPRFVCGHHWKSSAELGILLEQAFSGQA